MTPTLPGVVFILHLLGGNRTSHPALPLFCCAFSPFLWGYLVSCWLDWCVVWCHSLDQSEKEQREESTANRFIGELEASISKLAIVPDSSPLTPKLALIFWALSL